MLTCAAAFWASSVVAGLTQPYHWRMRVIALLLLLAPALAAQSLLEQFYPGKSDTQAAASWYEGFQGHVIAECTAGRPIEAVLALPAGGIRCRIVSADAAALVAHELWFTGQYTPESAPVVVPAAAARR